MGDMTVIGALTECTVRPGEMLSVPLVLVKSLPAAAVPFEVA